MKQHDTGSQRPVIRRTPDGMWRLVQPEAAPRDDPPQFAAVANPRTTDRGASTARGRT